MPENPITSLVLACVSAIALLFIALILSAISRRYSRYEKLSDSYGNTWEKLVDRGPVATCASCLGSLVGIVLIIVILAILCYVLVIAGSFITKNWNSIARLLSAVGTLLAGLVVLAIGVAVIWVIIKFAIDFVNDLFHPEKYD